MAEVSIFGALFFASFGFAELANGLPLERWRGFAIRAICSVLLGKQKK